MIFVVDDHADTRQLLLQLLSMDGFQAAGAENGNEALQFLARQRPKLVLLDYSLPDMNGLSIFRAMRNEPHLRDVPVIMFSALDGEVKDEALREGVSAYVVKGSMDWADMRKQIDQLIGPPEGPQRVPIVPTARSKDAC